MSSPDAPDGPETTDAPAEPTAVEAADAPATEAVEPAGPVDEVRAELLAALTAELGDALVGSHIRVDDDLWIRVTRAAWRHTGMVIKEQFGFRAFEFLSAIDWLPSPFGKNEDSPTDPAPTPSTDIVTGYAGGDTRFQVFARAHSYPRKLGITVKVDLPDDDLTIDSWLPVYAGVNWHEREAHEMFGIGFHGHPYLMHLYLPGEFEGNPLRKDFPLLARQVKPWPGIVDVEPMPAGSDDDASEEATEGADA